METLAIGDISCWVCSFQGRAGAKAQASFGSAEAAKNFAERHAGSADGTFEWGENSSGVLLLNRPHGTYSVQLS